MHIRIRINEFHPATASTKISPLAGVLEGPLFFPSAARFQTLFSPHDDPDELVVEFRRARVMNHSAVEAIDMLATRYQQFGKRLQLSHLSPDCSEVPDQANDMVELNIQENPHYHIADNKLG